MSPPFIAQVAVHLPQQILGYSEMTDKKDDKVSPKKTMKQLVAEKAKSKPHYLSLKNKAKQHKGSNKAHRPII